MDELPDLTQLTHAQKDALIVALWRHIQVLQKQVEALGARVAELEGRLSKDSHNSSKPPSSDALAKKPQSLRQASGLRPGGQPGHKGTTLKRVAVPDRVVRHDPSASCDRCGQTLALADAVVSPDRRQVFDLPPLRLEVTEHQVSCVRCGCGQWHRGAFPEGVDQPVQYGPTIKAAAVYLTQYQLLPVERTSAVLGDLCGLPMSPGTIQACIAAAQRTLTPAVTLIAAAVTAAPVAHFDETGQRVAGRLRWLHAASTADLTWYGAHDKRGRQAMDAFGILPAFSGIAVHDGWASYKDYACEHALCNAHHLRELTYLAETVDQAWPQQLIDLLCAAKTDTDQARETQIALSLEQQQRHRERYDALLAEGERLHPRIAPSRPGRRGRVKQSTATNLLGRLRDHADDVLRFLYDPRVPFDNNQAERDIRMPKLKQKVSGCFRTPEGADAFCINRSYLATLRKQGRDLFQALILTFQNNPPSPLPVG